jgi:hypothetical protein
LAGILQASKSDPADFSLENLANFDYTTPNLFLLYGDDVLVCNAIQNYSVVTYLYCWVQHQLIDCKVVFEIKGKTLLRVVIRSRG